MKRTVWTFGLISGGILAVTMLLTVPFQDSIGFERGMIVGYTTMVLAFLLVHFGIRSYRENVAGGYVGFGRAFSVGALIVVVAAVCYALTWQFVYFKLSPDFMEKYQAYEVERARESGATEAQIDARREQFEVFAEKYRNPLYNAGLTFLEPLPVGLLIALVSAGVLRKRREETVVGLPTPT